MGEGMAMGSAMRWLRGCAAALAALIVVGATGGVAEAATNPHIEFSDSALVKLDPTGNALPPTDNTQLTVGDKAKLSFKWVLQDGQPLVAGDSFTLTLPPELKMAQTSNGGLGKPELKVPSDPADPSSEQIAIATCSVVTQSVTCTFNDDAARLVAVGNYDNFGGTIGVTVQAAAATPSETLPLTYSSGNPAVINVDLPGTGGIKAQVVRPYNFVPYRWAKGSTGIGNGSTTMNYNVPFSPGIATGTLGKYLQDMGDTRVFDGQTVQRLEFTDTLGAGQRFFAPASWELRLTATRAGGLTNVLLDTGADGATTTPHGEFNLTVIPGPDSADGQTARITLTGPFSADANYTLHYRACSSDATSCEIPVRQLPALKPGFKYTNTIDIDGANRPVSITRQFSDAFTSDIITEPGFGTLAVTKFVAGPGSMFVAAEAPFTVNLTYTLPAAASTYPNWQPPGQLNADGITGTATLVAKVGKKLTLAGPDAAKTLPVGTKVVLGEITDKTTAPIGYEWDNHEFVLNNQAVTEVTIADRYATPLELTNTLAKTAPGKFSISKNVEGLGAGYNAPAQFTFHYVCNDPAATEGDLQVPGDGTVVESPELPAGAGCQITEDEAAAQVPSHQLQPQLSTAYVSILANNVAAVTAWNRYSLETGKFSVAKSVEGLGAGVAVPAEFTFHYVCDDVAASSGDLKVPGDGSVVESPAIPAGAKCTVSEKTDGAEVVGYTLTPAGEQQVTIVKDQVEALTAKNVYSLDVGKFSVAKSVEANGASVPGQFAFKYVCDDAAGTQGVLQVPGDGSAVESPAIPAGAKCQVSEDTTSAQVAGYSLASTLSASEVTIAKDQVEALTAKNVYTQLKGAVGDRVWFDADGDGLQGADEKPAPGVSVTLYDEVGQVVATTNTDANGNYRFGDLPPGEKYTLEFQTPAGYEWTKAKAGDPAVDSDVNKAGRVEFTATDAEDLTVDAGLVVIPIATPTTAPTVTPTTAPTAKPTVTPTATPTGTPTTVPTVTPTSAPSASPTKPTLPPVRPGLPSTGG